MKFVHKISFLNTLHGLHSKEARVLFLALASLLLICAYKRFTLYLLNRKLGPIFGQKKDSGFAFEMRRYKNRYEFWIFDKLLYLSGVLSQKELLERYLHIDIANITSEKRGLLFLKKTIFIIYAEVRLNKFNYPLKNLKLKKGDILYGWDLSLSKYTIENTESGAFSILVVGSSGSGKSTAVKILLSSACAASITNNEAHKVIIADPKTTYMWAQKSYGAKIINPTTSKGAKQFRDSLQDIYDKIISSTEALKSQGIAFEHVNQLTNEDYVKAGIEPFIKTYVIIEEFERIWGSDRAKPPKPSAGSGEETKLAYEFYMQSEASGFLCSQLLGLGRAYNVVIILATQSALVSATDHPKLNSIQCIMGARISPEASNRIFGDSRICTSSNLKNVGDFILKSDRGGIRKIQVPKFSEDK